MENKTLIIGIAAFLVGVVLGYVLAPQMPGRGYMMRGAAQNIDAHFIEQMIPHHEGAVAMASMALERSTDPRVQALAQEIVEAQTEEIGKMQRWYEDWYGRAPVESMGHGGMHMQGMEGDLAALNRAADFDQEFLRQMIVHHEAAVMMAQMLESGTARQEMRELAGEIIASQTREIGQMRDWLADQ